MSGPVPGRHFICSVIERVGAYIPYIPTKKKIIRNCSKEPTTADVLSMEKSLWGNMNQ